MTTRFRSTGFLPSRRGALSLLVAAAVTVGMPISPAEAAGAPAPAIRNVVLVHGAWAGASSWSKVIPQLEVAGLHVAAVRIPLTSLADDVAATQREIALADGPVLLVGHSYGGAVISQAGNDPKVAGLVYVAAFAPDAGQGAGDLGKEFPPPPGLAELRPDAGGFLKLTDKGIDDFFAPDVPPAERRIMSAIQGPTNGAALGGKVTTAAWKTKPTWYVVASHDQMISPELEKQFAKAMNAKTIVVPASHVAMLSHPNEVARLIIEAAGTPPAH